MTWPYEIPFTCSVCGGQVLALSMYEWVPGPSPVCGCCQHAQLWGAPAPEPTATTAPTADQGAPPPVAELLQMGLLSEEALARVRAKRPHGTL